MYGVIGRLLIMTRAFKRILSLPRKRSNHAGHEALGDRTGPRPDLCGYDLRKLVLRIRERLGESPDLTVRSISILERPAAVFYLDTLIDKESLHETLLVPLLRELEKLRATVRIRVQPQWLVEHLLSSWNTGFADTTEEVVSALLEGDAVLLVQGWNRGIRVDVKGWERRPIGEPQTEVVVRGSREGFTEDIMVNVSLIRRRVHHPGLRFKLFTLGRLTRTRVIVAYIDRLARADLVDEVLARVSRIDVGCVLDSGYVEEFIEDNPMSPFPQVVASERPDRVVSILLEGGVAVLVDGSPFALAGPLSLARAFQMPEDYYGRWLEGTVMRLVRFVSAGISLLAAPVYVALTTFHQELLPRPIGISLSMQREFVPYPAIVETIIMLLVFEVLIEASIRLPRVMGQTIGIVGVLVLGDAAVRAGLISGAMVIVVSLTALCQFTLAHQITMPLRIVRLPMLVLASVLGLYGIFCGLILLLLHLCSLRSFGQPYMAPFAPFIEQDVGDSLIRVPWWAETTRPVSQTLPRTRRTTPGQKPGPPRFPGRRLELESVMEEDSGKPGRQRREEV